MQAISIDEVLAHKATRWILKYCIRDRGSTLWHSFYEQGINSQVKSIAVTDI